MGRAVYCAVDSGKFATKIAWTNEDFTKVQKCQFRTKMSAGNMLDDNIENGTYVCQIGDEIFKIGNGAQRYADLVTSKKSPIHKNCTLLALALLASDSGDDEFHVAIGMPVDEYGVVDNRIDYMKYMLPQGETTVLYRTQKTDIITKKFKIVSSHVYPESAGGLYLNASRNKDSAAIIDIGSLNVNLTMFQGFEVDKDYSITGELGGQILVSNLAAELSASLGTRCTDILVSRVLKSPLEQRYLVPNIPNPDIEEKSFQIINEYLLKHVSDIKRLADSKKWSLDFIPLTFIGGTSEILANEIRKVFGESVFIPSSPEYTNALGFLKRIVAYETDVELSIETESASRPAA